MPVHHPLEQTLNDYNAVAGLQNGLTGAAGSDWNDLAPHHIIKKSKSIIDYIIKERYLITRREEDS